MSYLGTTRNERMTIEEHTFCEMAGIELASQLLHALWAEYFEIRVQEAIAVSEAEILGCRLLAALAILDNAIRNYHLTLGHYGEACVQHFIEEASRLQKTIEAEKAADTARKLGQIEAVKEAGDMDNDAAIAYLNGVIKGSILPT